MRGTGPGRVGRLDLFGALEALRAGLRDAGRALLERAVPEEDPRDFVDVRDAIGSGYRKISQTSVVTPVPRVTP